MTFDCFFHGTIWTLTNSNELYNGWRIMFAYHFKDNWTSFKMIPGRTLYMKYSVFKRPPQTGAHFLLLMSISICVRTFVWLYSSCVSFVYSWIQVGQSQHWIKWSDISATLPPLMVYLVIPIRGWQLSDGQIRQSLQDQFECGRKLVNQTCYPTRQMTLPSLSNNNYYALSD